VDTVEEAVPPKNQREIELLQRENDKLNERFDRLMLVNEQLIKQHENEQILRRDMQTQLTGLTAQLGQLRSEYFPLLEDKSRLKEEHKSLKVAVMDLIKHISTKNKP
jgi:chromosome segregation ATPase